MIGNITIIKYMQVFDCCISVQPAWIQKNCFTKDLLTLAKFYPGTMDTINIYVYSPGTKNIMKFKPAPDNEVDDLADKTDVNSTSVIKWDLENPSDSFMNWFCCQVLKRVYGQMMREAEIKLKFFRFCVSMVWILL